MMDFESVKLKNKAKGSTFSIASWENLSFALKEMNVFIILPLQCNTITDLMYMN